ncbi:MAG TPA: hypothetical protein VGP61_06650 [Gemmatimonadales bacterium]|jgi:hypothetical protein|nr:hypothetical protein [Gemmatimonadales bacterium]
MVLDPRRGVLCCLLGLVLPSLGGAQSSKTNTMKLSIAGLGKVVSKTPLKKTNRAPGSGGNLWVEGSVTTSHVGPYQLQVKLGNPSNDTVKIYVPPSTTVLSKLSTTTWTTIAVGPGGTNKLNQVAYLIAWGKNSAKKPADAEAIPVVYQVVP